MKKLLIIVVLLIDIAFVSAGFTCQAAISASEKEYITKIKEKLHASQEGSIYRCKDDHRKG